MGDLIRRHALVVGFFALAVFALWRGGAAALDGLPHFVEALTPGMAAQAEAPSPRYVARLMLPGFIESRFAPQILYPVQHNVLPAWLTQAAEAPAMPVIAICIDDLGEDLVGTTAAIRLPKDVALAFLPFAGTTPFLAAEAKAQGHTVLAHVPMQPLGTSNPGPMMLAPGMDRDEILRRLNWSLERVPGAVGVNNHEGSRFTADMGALQPVMETLKARHLFFFDSRTSGASKGEAAAQAAGVDSAGRDIFLDDDQSEAAVKAQLAALVATAKRQGAAIAIGHPHTVTLRLVAEWLKQDHGVKLVTLEEAMRAKAARRAALAAN